jgi:DNA-binding NarL/FixJ family response regulator
MARTVIIEDDRGMRLLATIAAEETGCQVIGEAETGADGVALVVRRQPDIVVMDYRLPDIDGAEATRQIRAAVPDVRVVAWTSADDEATAQRLTDAGADVVLPKQRIEDLSGVLRGWATALRPPRLST